MPPAFVPEDVLQHLQAVKTNFPHLTLEETIHSTWSGIKADKNQSSKPKKSVIKMAREQLDKQLHAEQLLKHKPDAPFPTARHPKKIKNWMDSDTTTKTPKVLNQKLNYLHLLKMEQAPRSHPNLIHAWHPSLIQGIDLLTTRYTGAGMLLTKFHHLLHMEHYCRIHGSMANFDGSRPESIDKTIAKDPGSRTQHQPTKLTYQCAEKLADVRNIQYFGTQLFRNHWHLYQKFDIDDSLAAHLIPPDLALKVPHFRPHNGVSTTSLFQAVDAFFCASASATDWSSCCCVKA